MTTTPTSTLIESETTPREYGMLGTKAIIDHPKHGRLLLNQQFGGWDSLEGGSVRWSHGYAIALRPADTLSSLDSEPWNEDHSLLDAVLRDLDPSRPMLDLPGWLVEQIARSANA